MKRTYNYDSIFAVKRQGVFYNTEFHRWEYYGENPITRGGEPQPEFVSDDYEKCLTYKMATERA